MVDLKRDPKGSMAYWNTWTEFSESTIEAMWRQVRDGIENEAYKPQFLFDIARRHADLMLYRYSRGDAVHSLTSSFEGLLDAWEASDQLGATVWDEETFALRRSWSKNIDFYNLCFRLIGLATLLDIPEVQWKRLLALIANEGEDVILDTVIAHRSPERGIGSRVCFPKAYGSLHKVLRAEPAERPMLLQKFLEVWFNGLELAGPAEMDRAYRTPYWWKSCADEAHGMKGGYFGCWCVEAAVVAKVLAIDDLACLPHPHYPGDLLIDGRSPRYEDAASPLETVEASPGGAETRSWFGRLLGKASSKRR